MALIDFKQIENLPETVTIHGEDGNPVTVSVKPLSGRNQETVLWALDQIKAVYQPEGFDIPVEMIIGVAANTGFIETDSIQTGAYSWGNDTDNMLILFAGQMIRPTSQFLVALLHELIHFLLDDPDFMEDSSFEARLDLDCYRALGLPIPADHCGLMRPVTGPSKPE